MEHSLHPDAALWLERTGIPLQAVRLPFDWNPLTLKQIGTHALALGKASGQIGPVMEVLAEIEIRLNHLRNEIGIDRSAPPDILPRATTLFRLADGWISPGRWIPDILDRAAAFDPLHAGFPGDRAISLDVLRSYRLDHVILLDDEELELEGCQCHRSATPWKWLHSGPSVFDCVRETAVLIHPI